MVFLSLHLNYAGGWGRQVTVDSSGAEVGHRTFSFLIEKPWPWEPWVDTVPADTWHSLVLCDDLDGWDGGAGRRGGRGVVGGGWWGGGWEGRP